MARNTRPITEATPTFPRSSLTAVMALAFLVFSALAAPPGALAQLAKRDFAVQHLSYFKKQMGLPLEKKVERGTPELIDKQYHTNLDFGVDVRPRRSAKNHPLEKKVRSMLAGLPPEVKKLAGKAVMTVFLVEGDFGTGTTEAVMDDNGEWKYSYVVLNLSALDRTANQWGSWKDESAFKPQSGFSIRMTLEPEASDDQEGALRFIFLHELGHVLGQYLGAHGSWEDDTLGEATLNSPYLKISWKPEGNEMVSHWKTKYSILGDLKFYQFAGAPLSIKQAEKAYGQLAKTDFPSLYGATNYFDDFAESMAIYIHTRVLHKPYLVEVLEDGKVRQTYRSCFQDGRCENKALEIQKLLGF